MTDMEASDIFRDNVHRLIEERGLTKSGLARLMGASPQYVNGYLTESEPTEPGLRVLCRFADALNCEPWELIRPEKVPA